ncbi:MAG: hypothetical protein A3K59_05585 [Euryarchaeota archaeon RBG_19FT_COMBO_69_17]|nr:MAG: hypothetical protein A3K59_05585 [Euryarchaeota archaeon RBG_19FT_COMBO_69_17]
MCTLVLLWRTVPGYDLVVGMNRDESSMRPADPPSLLGSEVPVVPPAFRSRGQLVLDALRAPSVPAVDILVQREVREHEYNFWNLLAATREEVRFFRYDGRLTMTRGHEGLNVLTNEGGNVAGDAKAEAVQDLLGKSTRKPIEETLRALQGTLRTHGAGRGPAICVHGAGGGTTSATILAVSNADVGENVLLYADGAPCSTPFRDYRDVVRRLPNPR